jgi:phosphatidylglycerophosphatase A
MSAPPLWHPATLIATWFGSGLLPRAPGTWGSLAALPFAFALQWWGGWVALAIGALAVLLLGWWAIGVYLHKAEESDPGPVVVDEVFGQFLALLPATPDPLLYAAAFALFRLFDVWKPWPVGWVDRRLDGPMGVMLDDGIAGFYAAAGIVALRWLGLAA